jgi:hypothetical protein
MKVGRQHLCNKNRYTEGQGQKESEREQMGNNGYIRKLNFEQQEPH